MRIPGQALLRTYKTDALRLPVGNPVVAWLRPAGTSPDDAAHLSEWRNRFVTSFLTEFQATPESTAQWLNQTVGPDDTRILFMLDLEEGGTVGYLGLAFIDWGDGQGEADAVVRGEDAPKGLMTTALRTLLTWARGPLGLKDLGVRVRSDNPAITFYENTGFSETHRVPLRRTERPDTVSWVEDQVAVDSDLDLVHMVWTG